MAAMTIEITPGALAAAPTRLLYLDDPSPIRERAFVLAVQHGEAGEVAVLLDRTPFYPQRGGQPSDSGMLIGDGAEVAVTHAHLADDVVVHRGHLLRGEIRPGDQVAAEIDPDRRWLHTRIHSAGELLCAVAGELGVGGAEVAGAIHYPGRASVDFSRIGGLLAPAEFGEQLEAGANRIIQEGGVVHIVTVSDPDAVIRLCGYTPTYLRLGEDVRIVRMAGAYGRPCLGTHVANLCDIGPVKVRKVKQAKGRLTVSYHVEGMHHDGGHSHILNGECSLCQNHNLGSVERCPVTCNSTAPRRTERHGGRPPDLRTVERGRVPALP